MWIVTLVLLVIIAMLVFAVIEKQEHIEELRTEVQRQRALRIVADEVINELVEERVGDHLRSNQRRVSETAWRFDKARSDGRGPN